MKINYYKPQRHSYTLFEKKNTLVRGRYILAGLILLSITIFSYCKLVHKNQSSKKLAVNAEALLASNPLDEETLNTSNNLQQHIEQNSHKAETVAQLEVKPPPDLPQTLPQMVTVRNHDTLGKIFSRLVVNKKEVRKLLAAGEAAKTLKKLKAGQKITLMIKNHQVQQLTYNYDPISTLLLTRSKNDQFKLQVQTATLNPKQSIAKFTVVGSVNASAKKAGLDNKRTAQLATIFKSNVDINKGNHSGDKVSILFQDYYVNGKKVKDGEIEAAEYKTATNTYQVVRFTDPKGHSDYYTPDGSSLQKRFLPAPLKFTRISSIFNPKRWHPVLHRFRHHQGVDYAAPYGTPIKSVANGTIELVGRKGGYGNTIMIKHDSNYSTLYGHLSKYATGLKKGAQVQQGQVIGYVGSSGLATGPHLHFEFKINGVQRNPLTVALPNGKGVKHAYRTKFRNEVKKLQVGS